MRKRLLLLLTVPVAWAASTAGAQTLDCVSCHEKTSPAIVGQWRDSKHGRSGIDCLACHQGDKSRPDAFDHHGKTIVTVVTPKACAQCHADAEKEFSSSHHAKAAQFIGSLDNFLGTAVEGAPAAALGCQQCHGSTVAVLKNGKLDPATWPNSGIGRVNPDGSIGSCAACHSRHTFSREQARQPENCGKCHMGPDHPQIEIYKESKHGILFEAFRGRLNMDKDSWIAGKDYNTGPTCASCHMSATPSQPITHDVGARISWTLRPVISTKLENWEGRRKAMQNVCAQCHAAGFIDNFYHQFDSVVDLYNNKFALPAKAIMDELRKDKLLTDIPFDEKIEWVYYELWHHQGRRARHGASMMGPDYTQWHGFYEVAKTFYMEFIPEAEEHKKGVSAKYLDKDEYHKWRKGLDKGQMQGLVDFYKKRYGQ